MGPRSPIVDRAKSSPTARKARSREAEEHGWSQVPVPLSCALEEGGGTLAVVWTPGTPTLEWLK